MGSEDEHNAEPEHSVELSSFRMDLTEVTVAAYEQCVRAGACSTLVESVFDPFCPDTCLAKHPGHRRNALCNWRHRPARNNHPINCVSWFDANSFCRWAGKRLPTEEEWEYAARGTDGRQYPWGNAKPSRALLNACGAECTPTGGKGWKPMYPDKDPWVTTAPVASYAAGESPWGLYDMSGNVVEWTVNHPCPYSSPTCSSDLVVLRGGGWGDISPGLVSAASRFYVLKPEERLEVVGFRCVC